MPFFARPSGATHRPPDRINDCLRPFAATASVFLHSEWDPFHHPLTPPSRNPPHHTDLSSTIIDGRIPAASRALSIPDRIPATIAATVARTCRKKTTGKTRLYVRGDFPLELGNTAKWGEEEEEEEEEAVATAAAAAAVAATTEARRRWLKKKVKRSFPCGKYDSLPA